MEVRDNDLSIGCFWMFGQVQSNIGGLSSHREGHQGVFGEETENYLDEGGELKFGFDWVRKRFCD